MEASTGTTLIEKPATQVMDVSAVTAKEVQSPMGQLIVPQIPEGMAEQTATSLETQANEWVAKIMAMPDDQNLHEQVAMLGMGAQSDAGSNIEVLKTKISAIMSPPTIKDGDAPENLAELRKLADRLDPSKISQPLWYEKLFSFLPSVARKQVQRSIDRIHNEVTSAEDEINSIMDSLRVAGETVLKSNAEIDVIVEKLQPMLESVKATAYLGELMLNQLQAEFEKLPDGDPKKGQLLNFTTPLASRYLDLNSMRELYNQLLIGLRTARQNNLVRAVSLRRTIDVAGPALRIGTALQVFDLRQQQAAALDQGTRDFVSDLTARNAEAVGESQRRAYKDMASAVLDIEKMKTAHDNLIKALDERDAMQLVVIQTAKQNAIAFKEMAEELEARQKGVKLAATSAPKTIEAQV